MNRRGTALLLVLWLVAALAGISGVALHGLRIDTQAARNRLVLIRAAWARESCVAILLARFDTAASMRGVDSTDLGHGAWCSATVHDPAERLNLNLATDEQVQAVVADDALASALLDWRDSDSIARPLGAEAPFYAAHAAQAPRNGPFASLEELRLVRGFAGLDTTAVRRLFTLHGSGRINAARAPVEVLSALPGMSRADAQAISLARSSRDEPQTLGGLLDMLPPARAEELRRWGPELQAAVTFGVEELVVEVTGAAGGSPLRAHGELIAVPTPARLALVRRVIW